MSLSTFNKQFRVLLWKNCVIKIRQPIATFFELFIPILIVIFIMINRNLQPKTRESPCNLREKQMDSMGPLPFIRDFICSFKTDCYKNNQIDFNSTDSNEFLTFLENTTILYNAFPKGQMTSPKMYKWMAENPDQMQRLNNSLNYIENVSLPLLEAVNMVSSDNDTEVSQGIDRLSTSICGSNENNVKYLISMFSGGVSSRRKRYSKSCQDDFRNRLYRTIPGSEMYGWFAPILFGKIYYTPVSNFTKHIITQANLSYVILDNLRLASIEWRLHFRAWLVKQLTNSSGVDNLRNNAATCVKDNVPGLAPNCKVVSRMLNKTTILSTINSLTIVFQFLENTLNCTQLDKFVPVDSASDIDNFSNKFLENVLAGVVFDPSFLYMTSKNATFLNLTIRIPTNRIDLTTGFRVLDQFWTPVPRTKTFYHLKYYTSGFLMLQESLERAFVEVLTKKNVTIGSSMQIMPYPCYVSDDFIQFASNLLPFMFIIGWCPAFAILVKRIVHEKEKRLKEFMLVMGLSHSVHWLAWFVISLLTTIIPTVVIVLVLWYKNIMGYTSPGVTFLLFFSYSVCFICQAFAFTVFFDKANVAAVVAGLIYFICFIPFLVLVNIQSDITYVTYYATSIFPQVLFSNGLSFISYWEQTADGSQFNTLLQGVIINLDFGVGNCIFLLWVVAAFYLLIALYVEEVFPGKYGIPQPWYFFVTKKYWVHNHENILPYQEEDHRGNENEDLSGFEKASPNLEVAISIRNLRKVFSRSKVPAVDSLNLDFYKSHITAFLGHNGAGKTTTISILTGIFPPTSGTAYIFNDDIRTDIESVRKNLGLCPQHNVLFDNLTVEDHIYFYGLLRGMTNEAIKSSMPKIIDEIGLTKKRNSTSKNLSGGMKRKLSVAMAFLGESRAIILDEPTAGVDPFARRGIWDLLLKYRSPERTIILTTHHMDEADYLSDRIAIISQGKLTCCGSSVFLKRHFGDGYYLFLAKSPAAMKEDFDENEHSVSGKTVYSFISKHVEGLKFFEENRTQWIIVLPYCDHKDNGFSTLFQNLDNSLENLNISSYGLSDTSLEDVFLKVAEDPSNVESQNENVEPIIEVTEGVNRRGTVPKPLSRSSLRDKSYQFHISEDSGQDSEKGTSNYVLLSGIHLLWQQILALEIKKFHYTKRNVKGIFSELLLPLVMVLLIVGLLKLVYPFTNQPLMTIQPWLMMPRSSVAGLNTFYRTENVSNTLVSSITDLYRTDLGESGTRCMDPSVYSLQGYKCSPNLKTAWTAIPQGLIPLSTPACDCNETGFEFCSNPLSGGPSPSIRTMATLDTLMNLTGYNLSDHLMKKFKVYSQKLYGGYQFLLPSDFGIDCNYMGLSPINDGVRYAVLTDGTNDTSPILFVNYMQTFLQLSGIRTNYSRIWVNTKGYVSMPAYANILDNLLMRASINSSISKRKYGMIVNSYPFKYSQSDLLSFITNQMLLEAFLSNFVILALSLIPASFVLFLIEERVSGSKRQQLVSGINPYVYWFSNFLWDITKYLISAFLIILIFLAFSYDSYTGPKNVGVFISLMCLYGFAIIPHMYPFSFFIKSPSTAFVVLAVFNLFVGCITTMATYFLDGMQQSNPSLIPLNAALKQLFLIFPQFDLGRGMMDMSFSYMQFNISKGQHNYDPFAWDQSGQKLAAMGVICIFWWAVVLIIESGLINRIISTKLKSSKLRKKEVVIEEDFDVALERERINTEVVNEDLLKVKGLTKIYNQKFNIKCKGCRKMVPHSKVRKLAVNNISFGVKAGECFGLLGVNGAGKTTTFKMLTGEEFITKGDAMINGISLSKNVVAAHKNMGYCPQCDALHSILTCEEELYFYCRIRGIQPLMIKETVESSFKSLGLLPHAKKRTHNLSGGNKRKLSTAISLIGNPSVVLMDEPTSGMDAGARRFLWSRIQKLTSERRAVILTSHNMEECEVLCDRLAIMVDGQFQCFGSVQSLKSKFGDDYHITLRINSTVQGSEEKDRIKDIVSKQFQKGVNIKDETFVTLQYVIDYSMYKLSSIFDFFEGLKVKHLINDFSVCQTSLDEIFISFAKNQGLSKTSDADQEEGTISDKYSFENINFDGSETSISSV